MTPRFGFISLARRRSLLIGVGLAAGLLSCARNPVTGKSELALISESQEIQMGQEAAKDVAQTIGLYKDPKLEAKGERERIGGKLQENSRKTRRKTGEAVQKAGKAIAGKR